VENDEGHGPYDWDTLGHMKLSDGQIWFLCTNRGMSCRSSIELI